MSKGSIKSKGSLRLNRSTRRASKLKRAGKSQAKPFGFCCSEGNQDPHSKYRRSLPTKTSCESLRSLHECPVLRVREQVTVKRPHQFGNGSTNLGNGKVNFQPLGEAGEIKLDHMSPSAIELMIDEARTRRQLEYEMNMDKWAAIGEMRAKKKKKKVITSVYPYWYTEFSLPQLKNLKELELALFKDKEEKTTNRTFDCLIRIGVINDTIKVNSKIIRRLLNEFSSEPIKFMYEIYKAITGNYFENEGSRRDYSCNERIILSSIAFLELPRVIIELHKRLPPIIKPDLPSKPKPTKIQMPKKMQSPLLESLVLPWNWREYETQWCSWRTKYLAIPKPLVILPKKTLVADDAKLKSVDINYMTHTLDNNIVKDNHDEKQNYEEMEKSSLFDNTEVFNYQNETADDKKSVTSNDKLNCENRLVPNWTEPPTPCPFKFYKILKEKGPLETDDEFFTELKRPRENKKFAAGRENLSMKMQNYLMDVEADFYHLTEQANQLTEEVERIGKEIFQEPNCDPCCLCRQTKKSHLKWHNTKTPHLVIDSVTVDENNKSKIIGGMAMHSPAPSISSTDSQKDKTKLRNIYPCKCMEDDEDSCTVLNDSVKDDVCFGKKFRPKAGPAYSCQEFGKKDVVNDKCGCSDNIDKCSEEVGACRDDEYDQSIFDDFGLSEEQEHYSASDEYEYIDDFDVPKKFVKTCRKCGMKMGHKCNVKKKNKELKRFNTICSCDSLAEFLQMDITRTRCVMPKRPFSKKESKIEKIKCLNKKIKKYPLKLPTKGEKKESKILKRKTNKPSMMSIEKYEKISKISKTSISSEVLKPPNPSRDQILVTAKKAENAETKSPREPPEGGPYGYRTRSEEELPIQRTIAYLVDPVPKKPAEMIPLRAGGRACRCRENRNNRKSLLYRIGGTVGNAETGDAVRIIEGIAWLTPEPSIRGSNEYIPEYELTDSPYEKRMCSALCKNGSTKQDQVQEKCCDDDSEDRSEDWINTLNDPHLIDFYTKKRSNIPCWNQCSKLKKEQEEVRKLKIMKPVCECKYERRIVKRNEEKKERQRRLESLAKESLSHIVDISKPLMPDGQIVRDINFGTFKNENLSVAMQTPFNTPAPSLLDVKTSFDSVQYDNFEKINELCPEKEKEQNQADLINMSLVSEKSSIKKGKTSVVASKDLSKDVEITNLSNNGVNKDDKPISRQASIIKKVKTRNASFYDRLEQKLKALMHEELRKMSEEGFISVRLTEYHEMPQLLYWISYRVRGLNYSQKYKRMLMESTEKLWKKKQGKLCKVNFTEEFHVPRKLRSKLNFDHAQFWKRKIAKTKLEFYANMQEDIVNLGRDFWYTVEFGKFPNILYKQAYFTYLPTREKDVYVKKLY